MTGASFGAGLVWGAGWLGVGVFGSFCAVGGGLVVGRFGLGVIVGRCGSS
jgi:hypothetical protein